MEETITLTKPKNTSNVVKSETSKFETVDIPSNGYFYDPSNPLSSGKVNLKYMTAGHEDLLSNEKLIKSGEVLNRLLDALIMDDNIDTGDLLIGDKNALFVAARRLAYGDSYGPVKITCKQCRKETEQAIDLSLITNKPFDFSKFEQGKNCFRIELPLSKKIVEFKIPTSKDETISEGELKALTKINKAASGEVTTRLRNIIVSVDGNTDKSYIRKFVDTELLSRDSIVLRNEIKKNTPDLDLSFDFTCEHCDNNERMDVPMTVQFFWPNS